MEECHYPGCHNPPAPGRKRCQHHLDQQHQYYRNRRAANLARGKCLMCGKEPPEKGRKYCLACLVTASERNAEHYPRRAEKARAYAAQKRIEHLAAGLCRCGRPRKPDRMNCEVCNQKHIRNVRERRQRRFEQGLCIICGKEPALPGLKIGLCSKRYGERYKFQPRPLPPGHPWRRYENARISEIFWKHDHKVKSA